MNSHKYIIMATVICFLFPEPTRAQGYGETVVFLSTDSSQWSVRGHVTFEPSDTTLGFLFDFDREHPPTMPPDTAYLDIVPMIDLLGCRSAYIRFASTNELPTEDSWVTGRVRMYGKHELRPDWFPVFEDISDLAGRVSRLSLRFKVAVRTSRSSPGAFRLNDIRVTGNCGS